MILISSNIKEVAEKAGVSMSTVSRVFNKTAPVSEQKKERVIEAAEKLDYKPNWLARGLKNKKTFLIGYILPNVLNPYYAELVKNAEIYSKHKGYSLMIADSNNDPQRERIYLDDMTYRKVDGIILSTVGKKSQYIEKYIKDKKITVPIITLGRSFKELNCDSIKVDNYKIGQLASEHLIDLGYEKIGLVIGDRSINSTQQRLKGCIDYLKDNEIEIKKEWMFYGDYSIETGENAIKKFTEQQNYPNGIFCFNDEIALGAIKRLNKEGLKVPQDISVIGCDNTYISKYTKPELTTIHHPIKEMAIAAVDRLIEKIDEKTNKKEDIIQPVKLINRESTCKVGEKDE